MAGIITVRKAGGPITIATCSPAGRSRRARHEAVDSGGEPASFLLEWSEFHREVEALPPEECEVFGLLSYAGLTQAEAAETLGLSQRLLRRYWQNARVRLYRAGHGEGPAAEETVTTMSHDERFWDLADAWEQLYAQGAAPPVEELCRAHPDLTEPLPTVDGGAGGYGVDVPCAGRRRAAGGPSAIVPPPAEDARSTLPVPADRRGLRDPR